jgi:hypothetical protein
MDKYIMANGKMGTGIAKEFITIIRETNIMVDGKMINYITKKISYHQFKLMCIY